MWIEIHQPELEAMIQQRIDSGAFETVEDVLTQAIESLPAVPAPRSPRKLNLADFLMASPLVGSGLVIERNQSIPRSIDL